MNTRSWQQDLDYLEAWFTQMIRDPQSLAAMRALLQGSRAHQTVTIRAIDRHFMHYRQTFRDFSAPSESEQKMWQEFLNYWQ
ncbi:hypothetical protein ACUY4R_000839 [Kosakonia sp. BK9b]